MPDWVAHLPVAFLIFFGVVFVVCGMVLVLVGWSTLNRGRRQSEWLQVPAEILNAEVQKRAFDEGYSYQPRVTYRFSVGGSAITGTRMRLAERTYATRRGAERKLSQYLPGTTVMAHFPADHPEDAVLETGGGFAGLVLALFGLGMIACPLLLGAHFGYATAPIALGLLLMLLLIESGAMISRRRQQRARRGGRLPPPGGGSDADVAKLIGEGEKLLAIHLYREIHGVGLKEARQKVEEITADLSGRGS